MSHADALFSGSLESSQPGPSPPRVYAPMPKRRRHDRSDSGASLSPSVDPVRALMNTAEFSKVTEELLQQYEPAAAAALLQYDGDALAADWESLANGSQPVDTFDQFNLQLAQAALRPQADTHSINPDVGAWNDYRSNYMFEDDRLSDDYAARGGGKKRKVPASAQQGPPASAARDEPSCNQLHSCGHTCRADECDGASEGADYSPISPGAYSDCGHHDHEHLCDAHRDRSHRHDEVPRPQPHLTPIRRAIAFEKRLLQARKTQILGLHADAKACMDLAGQTKSKEAKEIPTKEELEELFSALEYAGVTAWEGDRVGIGAGIWEGQGVKPKSLPDLVHGTEPIKKRWRRSQRAEQRHQWLTRPAIKRSGWIPEGSFEYEVRSPVSGELSRIEKRLALLRSKVTQLLTLTLSPAADQAVPPIEPRHNMRGTVPHAPGYKSANPPVKPVAPAAAIKGAPLAANPPAQAAVPAAPETAGHLERTTSAKTADSAEVPLAAGKKGKKKKKRSAIANASNPHHVKNYIPSRRPTEAPVRDPLTLPDIIDLLFFPPPTRFLKARPPKAGAITDRDANPGELGAGFNPADPNNEEYMCCFCEYDILFGSDRLLDRGIRRRKKLLERREKVNEKAKGVIDGKGLPKTPKKPAKIEPECEGGDNCRCADIKAQRKSQKHKHKVEQQAADAAAAAVAAPGTATDPVPPQPATANQHVTGLDGTLTPPADEGDLINEVKGLRIADKLYSKEGSRRDRQRSRSPPDTDVSAGSAAPAVLLE